MDRCAPKITRTGEEVEKGKSEEVATASAAARRARPFFSRLSRYCEYRTNASFENRTMQMHRASYSQRERVIL